MMQTLAQTHEDKKALTFCQLHYAAQEGSSRLLGACTRFVVRLMMVSRFGITNSLLLVLIIAGSHAWAQETGLDESGPMHIEADKVVYGQDERRINFLGQVHVQRPDFELWCEEMTVFLNSENGNGDGVSSQGANLGSAGNVRKIVATDNVHLVMEDREATSDRAEYYSQEAKIILFDNVELKEKQNTVHGHQVTFWLDEERSEIVGKEDSRVKAVFFPEQEDKDNE
ncbi:MAG: LptA/OstA family protein [Desulfovermiculus sp.]